jgi:hypothetical protein
MLLRVQRNQVVTLARLEKMDLEAAAVRVLSQLEQLPDFMKGPMGIVLRPLLQVISAPLI